MTTHIPSHSAFLPTFLTGVGMERRARAKSYSSWPRTSKRIRIDYSPALAGRFLAMIFEKPSLRTRVTFEVGMREPGRHGDLSRPHGIRGWASANRFPMWRGTFRAGCTESCARVFEQRELEQLAAVSPASR